MYPSFITSATTTVLLPPVLFYAIRSVLMSPVATMAAVAVDRRCAITARRRQIDQEDVSLGYILKAWAPTYAIRPS